MLIDNWALWLPAWNMAKKVQLFSHFRSLSATKLREQNIYDKNITRNFEPQAAWCEIWDLNGLA